MRPTVDLHRTNRSGIIEGAGPIGGYAQAGKWKMDVRLVKEKQIENLKALSRYSSQIAVSNLDAFDFLQNSQGNPDAFVYLDPPYFVKGHKLYKNFYQPADHIEIAKELKRKRKSKWVVSYDDVPEIRDAYSAFSPITYLLNYSAGEKSVGTEVIFVSDALSTPDVRGFNMHHDRRPRVVDKKRSLRRSPGKLQIKNRKSDSK